jgi:hypothetical protein
VRLAHVEAHDVGHGLAAVLAVDPVQQRPVAVAGAGLQVQRQQLADAHLARRFAGTVKVTRASSRSVDPG